MKICNISYQQAIANHPSEVQDIMHKLRSGKSKHKDADGSNLVWWYECSIIVNSYSFGQLLSGQHHQDQVAFESLNFNDKVQDVLNRMDVTLMAKTDNRWSGWSGIEAKNFTPQIIEWAEKYASGRS